MTTAELATIEPDPIQQVSEIITGNVAEIVPLNFKRLGERPEVHARAKLTSLASKKNFEVAITHISEEIFRRPVFENPWETHGLKAAAIVYDHLFTRASSSHNTGVLYWTQYMKVLNSNTRLKYLDEQEYRFIDEDYKPKTKKGENAAREVMPWEWDAMLSLIDTTTDAGKMDYAMMMCCFPLGIRISDIAYLSVDYFNPERKMLHVANVKTKYPFEKPLGSFPDRAPWAIAAWLNVRGDRDSDAMFFEKRAGPGSAKVIHWDKPLRRKSKQGQGMTARTVGARIKRLAKKSGFEDISSHCGRVTACNALRRDEWDAIARMKLMGWQGLNMVEKYDRMSLDEFLKPDEVPNWQDAFLHPYVA